MFYFAVRAEYSCELPPAYGSAAYGFARRGRSCLFYVGSHIKARRREKRVDFDQDGGGGGVSQLMLELASNNLAFVKQTLRP